MCGSHRETWKWWCDCALLVTLIYLEFKAHLTSMATTAFCSDMPSHLVCTYWDCHLFFNRTMTQHTSRLCKGYLTKESDWVLHQVTWLDNHLTSTQLRWSGMSWTAEWRRSSQQVLRMWEILQDCWKSIPGDYLMKLVERMQSCHQGKGWLLKKLTNKNIFCIV
jgi:hypothetical protein